MVWTRQGWVAVAFIGDEVGFGAGLLAAHVEQRVAAQVLGTAVGGLAGVGAGNERPDGGAAFMPGVGAFERAVLGEQADVAVHVASVVVARVQGKRAADRFFRRHGVDSTLISPSL